MAILGLWLLEMYLTKHWLATISIVWVPWLMILEFAIATVVVLALEEKM